MQPDPALGISVGFDAAKFTDGVRFAMQMGAPPDVGDRVTFVFPASGKTYTKNGTPVATPLLDRDGYPLDRDIHIEETPGQRLQVDCAVQVTPADAAELPVGNFRPTKLTITLLDEQYQQVKGAREVTYAGDRYLFGYQPEVDGLFGVAVHTLIFYALDES